MSDITVLQQANGQRAGAKRASYDSMKKKRRSRDEFTAVLDPEEGPVSFLFVALSPVEYTELLSLYPPTEAQLKKDPAADINGDTFPPALLARVCKEPKLSEEQWIEIWADENYTAGERGSLFWAANNLCNRPLDLAPFATG